MTTYDATAVGATGAMSMVGLISVGAPADDSGYERFASQVAVLEGLEQEGKIVITERHQESSTGKRYVDLVRFKKLV